MLRLYAASVRVAQVIIISYLFMKNSAKPTRETIPVPNITFDPLPASFRNALFVTSISHIITFDVFFSGNVSRVFENLCFSSSRRKKRRSGHITSLFTFSWKEKPSQFSFKRKLQGDIIIALGTRWNSDKVSKRHGCHWQMKQSACPLSQLQTRKVKLH